MLTMLAQGGLWAQAAAPPSPPAANGGEAAFGADVPIEQHFWQWVSDLNHVQAALLVGFGLVYLLYGWKIFKILVLVNSALLGAWAGHWLGTHFELGWWPVPLGGLVLAVLAWPLLRYAVCVMGGLAGAVLGAFLARSMTLTGPMVAAGAAVGLVMLGLLAFIIFRMIVIGFTSIQGSLMTAAGVVGLVAKFQNMSDTVQEGLFSRPYMLPVMIIIPALIGFVYQSQRHDGKESAKKSALPAVAKAT